MFKSRFMPDRTELSSRLFGLLSAAFLGVLLSAGCSPSIDAAAKADVDRQIAALRPTGSAFGAPSGFVPMPLQPGQWVRYKTVDDKGQPSLLTQKILGEESGAYWFESVHDSYYGRSVTKILAMFGNRTDPSQLKILAAATKDTKGHVEEVPREIMPLLQSLYKSAVSTMMINWQGMPQESARVPAGNFDGCFKIRSEVAWATYKSVSDSWSHPSVPLSGMVRSKAVDSAMTMELVAFGTTGAVSDF